MPVNLNNPRLFATPSRTSRRVCQTVTVTLQGTSTGWQPTEMSEGNLGLLGGAATGPRRTNLKDHPRRSQARKSLLVDHGTGRALASMGDSDSETRGRATDQQRSCHWLVNNLKIRADSDMARAMMGTSQTTKLASEQRPLTECQTTRSSSRTFRVRTCTRKKSLPPTGARRRMPQWSWPGVSGLSGPACLQGRGPHTGGRYDRQVGWQMWVYYGRT